MAEATYFIVADLTPASARRQEQRCGAMAVTELLLLLELCLYAGCFCCGIVTAASIAIVQVTLTHTKKKIQFKKKTN